MVRIILIQVWKWSALKGEHGGHWDCRRHVTEVEYSLLSRAVENRVCIVAACREKSFTQDMAFEESNAVKNQKGNKKKIKSVKSSGFIANLTQSSLSISHWNVAKFTGYINQPLVKHQHGKITKALVHPIAAIKQ